MPIELLDISISKKSPAPKVEVFGWTTTRTFDDGTCEQVGPRGRRRRSKLIACVECETDRPETDFAYQMSNGTTGISKGVCRECLLAYFRAAGARARMARTKLLSGILEQPDQYRSSERRAAIFRFASPAWRDRTAIALIYEEARRLSKETGQPYDVDHIYPLQSAICCGLHVAGNLRIVKASINRSKSNTFPMHGSPAVAGMEYQDLVGEIQKLALGLD